MSETPLFDQAVFLNLSSELGEEDTVEVLEAFLADTSRKMGAMAAAVGDRSTIKREAHSIKSSAATFGFSELSALARQLEASAETMSGAELEQSVDALARAFERTSQLAQARLLTNDAEMAP
jgi:HPt (histidine-containing phosphotransfer) domain-containing protein